MQTFINLGSKINVISQDFAKKFVLWICETKVGAQKIDGSKLDIFGMIITSFLVENKEKRFRFCKKIFLLADINMDIALGMSFLTLNNVEIQFVNFHLHWRMYIISKILPTIRLIKKKEFVTTSLNLENKAFVVYIVSISWISDVHTSWKA